VKNDAKYRRIFYDSRVWPIVFHECCTCLDHLTTLVSDALQHTSITTSSASPSHLPTTTTAAATTTMTPSGIITLLPWMMKIQHLLELLYKKIKTQMEEKFSSVWFRSTHARVQLRYLILADYSLYTWACHALTQLLCASSEEDTLGVVSISQSLPRALITFVTCLQRLHDFNQCLAEEHPAARNTTLQGNLLTFYPLRALITTLSTAVTRLIVTFYSSLELYQFPTHVIPILQEFVHFARN
jgi:hypothetical protein